MTEPPHDPDRDYNRALDLVIEAVTASALNDKTGWEAATLALADTNRELALVAACHLAATLAARHATDANQQPGRRVPIDSTIQFAASQLRLQRHQPPNSPPNPHT